MRPACQQALSFKRKGPGCKKTPQVSGLACVGILVVNNKCGLIFWPMHSDSETQSKGSLCLKRGLWLSLGLGPIGQPRLSTGRGSFCRQSSDPVRSGKSEDGSSRSHAHFHVLWETMRVAFFPRKHREGFFASSLSIYIYIYNKDIPQHDCFRDKSSV